MTGENFLHKGSTDKNREENGYIDMTSSIESFIYPELGKWVQYDSRPWKYRILHQTVPQDLLKSP